ncbi:hypothetical protein D8674_014597 [Pyrus ussuriensis x Pyrus communis]|uniref:SWIM-type domain-containing protein n=1 Tax=Pyrus ussuriensis x Pyrus communis TaxID=2448454 RepID=A0A5N5GTY0_9ROSA|nr:hypothetical protein D8674_014597 [Pyrus ussuriensis x Pyrus communis]
MAEILLRCNCRRTPHRLCPHALAILLLPLARPDRTIWDLFLGERGERERESLVREQGRSGPLMEAEVGEMVKMEEERRRWGGEDGGRETRKVWVRWGGTRVENLGVG